MRRYLARMSPIGPNPERSGIMYNLNGWNIGYEVLCAGKRRGAGISQGLWGGGQSGVRAGHCQVSGRPGG